MNQARKSERDLQCTALDRATHERCTNYGEPEEGFDFFCCEGHLNELERELELVAMRDVNRHTNN